MLRSHPPLADDAPAAAPHSELEYEIRVLQARLAALTEQVSRNDSLLRKTQERELELLRAGSLAQLFERLIAGLRTSYQLDEVEPILHDPQHESRHLLSRDDLALRPPPAFCGRGSRVRRVSRSSRCAATSSWTACWCFPASTRCASPRSWRVISWRTSGWRRRSASRTPSIARPRWAAATANS